MLTVVYGAVGSLRSGPAPPFPQCRSNSLLNGAAAEAWRPGSGAAAPSWPRGLRRGVRPSNAALGPGDEKAHVARTPAGKSGSGLRTRSHPPQRVAPEAEESLRASRQRVPAREAVVDPPPAVRAEAEGNDTASPPAGRFEGNPDLREHVLAVGVRQAASLETLRSPARRSCSRCAASAAFPSRCRSRSSRAAHISLNDRESGWGDSASGRACRPSRRVRPAPPVC